MSVDATGALSLGPCVTDGAGEQLITLNFRVSVSLSSFQEVIGADFELSLCSRPHTHTHIYSTCLSLFVFDSV